MNMFSTMQRGAAETLAAQRRIPLPCPCCQSDCPLVSKEVGSSYYTVACENPDCPHPLCSEGETAAEAYANWNARVSA